MEQHTYIKVVLFSTFNMKRNTYDHPVYVLFAGMQNNVLWSDDNGNVHTKTTLQDACKNAEAALQENKTYNIFGYYENHPLTLIIEDSSIIIGAQEPYKTIVYEGLEYFDLNFYMQITLNLVDQFGIYQLATGISLQELEQYPQEF